MRIVLIPDWYIFARLCLKRICQSRYFAALYQGAWFFIFIRTRLFISVLHYRDKNRDTLLAIFCSCIIKGCVHVSMLLSWFYWKALHQELSLSRRTHPPNLFQEVSTHFFSNFVFPTRFLTWHEKINLCIWTWESLGLTLLVLRVQFFSHKCIVPQKQSCLCDNRFVIHQMAWSWQIQLGGTGQCTLASRKHVLINGFHGKLLFEEIEVW